MSFIIEILIVLITILIIWSVFKIEGKENRIKFIDDNADIIDKLLITEDGLPRFDFIESLPTSVEKLKKQIMYLIKIRNIRVLWIDPILDLLAIAKGSKADYDDIILLFENVRTNHHVTIMSILHTRKSLSSGGNGIVTGKQIGRAHV